MNYIPWAAYYILTTYLFYTHSSPSPILPLPIAFSPLVTINFLSVFVTLYLVICFIFQIPHLSENIHIYVSLPDLFH